MLLFFLLIADIAVFFRGHDLFFLPYVFVMSQFILSLSGGCLVLVFNVADCIINSGQFIFNVLCLLQIRSCFGNREILVLILVYFWCARLLEFDFRVIFSVFFCLMTSHLFVFLRI